MQNLKLRFVCAVMGSLALAVACTESGSGSPSSQETKLSETYSYGHQALPGSLPALSADYRPAHLDAKIIQAAGETYSPMDFTSELLSLNFDVALQRATATAVVQFEMTTSARPYFQMSPAISSITLDGATVATSVINDPDGAAETYIALASMVSPGSHQMEITYNLSPGTFSFPDGGAAILTNMTDLPDARYFETWAPSSFEDDAFALTVSLDIQNSTTMHSLFTNGKVSHQDGSYHWSIQFPDYFTTSSFYFHLTNKILLTAQFSVQGTEKTIPITLYSSNSALIDQAKNLLPGWFREYERDFGPYPHENFTAYLQASGGGMEYSGATISSIGALDHELFHSWFARGVMPAEGRAGWIDEALASWRDYDYFQAPSLLSRPPTFLANASAFEKSTPDNCYRDGRQLIAELDRVFAPFGGMKPLMKDFFERYKHQVVTTEEFWNFLMIKTAMNVDAYFFRFAWGQASPDQAQDQQPSATFSDVPGKSKHPAPLTDAEIQQLR
jgi:hypothetical protein